MISRSTRRRPGSPNTVVLPTPKTQPIRFGISCRSSSPIARADLFFGARETSYPLPGGGEWVIHHRGHENVLAVLNYLSNYYATTVGQAPAQIVLVGVSAGGYGVLYNYPAVAATFPTTTNISVLADSSNGIITPEFYTRALAPEGAWGVWEHLAPELEAAFAAGAQGLIPAVFQDLGWSHPDTRFGQYTRAFDSVQVLYYHLTRHLDNPERWADPIQLWIAESEWTRQAQDAMWMTAMTTANYRFYLGRGMEHTIIGDDRFYTENSAEGVYFSDWFKDMLEPPVPLEGNWRNVSCMPDCLPGI